MTESSFTPAELGANCTAAELEQLLARRAARLRAAALQDLAGDLSQLRKEQRERAQAAATAEVVFAAAQPTSPEDMLMMVSPPTGLQLGPVVLSANREAHWLTPAQAEAVLADRAGWSKRYRRELHTRELVLCREPQADLRATLAAGFGDDATHGERRPYETAEDARRIDDLLAVVVSQTHDLGTLRAWLSAAGDLPHAEILRDRIDGLVARGLDFAGKR